MKLNMRFLLAAAVAAGVLLAVPALALAAVWKDNGVNVTKFVEIGLSGGEIFETETGGMSCELHATLTTEGGSKGKITKFVINECPTGFGSLAGCTIVSAEAKGLPWTVHVNASDLTITNMRTRRVFNAGCGTAEVDKTIASTTVLLETPTAITEMEFSGETAGYKSFGSFTVDEPNSGTYGIG
jgi:hypothetical protein